MTPQQSIAHYKITSKLGEGGMGAVYRATDTKLGRDVAVKVLPSAFAADADRLARFTREAQVLASLNHPNIAAIYGVEDRALVMELVDGADLAGPLSEEQALPLIQQLIDALEDAHEKGIVHRDLKPANIKVTPDGRLKVLDFGLAKAIATDPTQTDPKSSPTLTMTATMAGMIVGTAAYMAPEQARGQAVDKRADIWAFGAVVYEILTGKQLFPGPTVSDTLAAVLRQDVSLEPVPPRFRRLLRGCLERDTRRRMRDIGDARLLLSDPLGEPAPAAAQVPAASRTPWMWPAIAGFLLLTTAAFAVREWRSGATPAAAGPVRAIFELTPAEQIANDFFGRPKGPAMAFSPDGSLLVFAGSQGAARQLYKRSLDQPEAVAIPGTTGANQPFFSPDGQWVGFFTAEGIRKVSLSGGPPVDIWRENFERTVRAQWGATWGAGNSIVFADGNLKQVSADGGTPRVLLPADQANDRHFSAPTFLPDGKTLLAARLQTDWQKSEIVVIPEGGAPRVLIQGGTSPCYAASGHIIFLRGATLLAAPFDLRKLALTGSPTPLLDDVMVGLNMLNSALDSGGGQFAVSRTGTLAYATGGLYPRDTGYLVKLDRKGAVTELGIKDRAMGLRFSPDGQKTVGFVSHGQSQLRDALLYDLERGTSIPLALGAFDPYLAWAPDGKRLAIKVGRASIGIMPAGSQGSTEIIVKGNEKVTPASWSADGKWLAYLQAKVGRYSQIWVKPMSPPGEPILFIDSKAEALDAMFSPDGKWIAYTSTETGAAELFVQPFPGPGEKTRISTAGGVNPVWAPNGRELFYLTRRDPGGPLTMMAVAVDTAAGFHSGTPHELFTLPADQNIASTLLHNYDVYPDGQHFIVPFRSPSRIDPVLRLQLVLNWFEELQRRAPAR